MKKGQQMNSRDSKRKERQETKQSKTKSKKRQKLEEEEEEEDELLIVTDRNVPNADLEEEKEQPPNELLPNMVGSNMPPGDMMDMFQLKQFEMDDDMGDIAEIKRFENITRSIAEKKRNKNNKFKFGATLARLHHRMHQNQDSSKFDMIYDELNSDDLNKVKNAITILNTELCMSNESMKNMIKPERFVKPLLNQLQIGIEPSLMILASTCLLTLTDLLPEISEVIIDEGGLNILEEKGKNFEYIDVAEDCVKLLDKIAEHCPSEVWQTGCTLHFLNFIDFFDQSVQNIIMNLVKKGFGEFYSINQWNQELKE